MKAEDEIPQMDGGIDDGVDPRDPGVPVSLVQIASRPHEALEIIESRVAVLKTIRIESIRRTNPEDWVAYRDEKTGREIAYLQDSGCQRIMPLWGIETHPDAEAERTPPQRSSDREEEFAYTVRGDGFCRFTGQGISNVEGTRYSTEKYATQSAAGIRREVAVKKAARANFDGTCVRKLTGMNSVPVTELLQAWGNEKLFERISKGRGYGTQDARVGGSGKEGVDQADIPKCDICQIKLVLRPAKGDRKAFWGCPSYEKHPNDKVFIDDEKWRAQIAARKKEESGDGGQ